MKPAEREIWRRGVSELLGVRLLSFRACTAIQKARIVDLCRLREWLTSPDCEYQRNVGAGTLNELREAAGIPIAKGRPMTLQAQLTKLELRVKALEQTLKK